MLADTSREVVLGMHFSPSPMQIYGLQRRILFGGVTQCSLLAATCRVEFVDRREFAAATVVQECLKDTSHCLEGLVPMQSLALIQSLLIPLISSEISLIFLHLILRPSFPSSQQSAYELNLSRPCRSTTLLLAHKTYLPFKLTCL